MRTDQAYSPLILAGALIGCLSLASPAHADVGSYAVPDVLNFDPLGVDIRSLMYEHQDTLLSIGDPANGGLAWSSQSHDFADPYRGLVTYWTIPAVTQSQYQVKIGPSVVTFLNCDSGPCQNASGTGSTLALTGSNWVYTAADGTAYTFNVLASYTSAGPANPIVALGQLLSIKSPDGSTTTIVYNGNTIKGVVSNRGFALKYGADGNMHGSGTISAVNLAGHVCDSGMTTCDGSEASITFSSASITGGVDGITRTVTQITDAAGSTWYYAVEDLFGPGDWKNPPLWTSRDGLVYFKSPQGYEVALAYDTGGRLLTLKDNRGTWNYSYPDETLKQAQDGHKGHTTVVTDPSGAAFYTSFSNITYPTPYFKDALGRITQYGYRSGTAGYDNSIKYSMPESITYPEGNSRTWSYDSRGNINQVTDAPKAGSGQLTQIRTLAFPATCSNIVTCNKPTSVTDANNNVTSYTYDSTTGQVLTETLPAAPVQANGPLIAPVKRYAYVQRYAWIKNPSGGFMHAGGPISLLATEKTCASTATNVGTGTCAGGSADEIVTTYDYGPDTGSVGNNLLLRGKLVSGNGVSLRTCYGYDALGNKIWETTPRAGLAACY